MSGGPAGEAVIDVCLCTHDPRPDILGLTIASLARQTARPDTFRVLVVDNASSPAIPASVLDPLRAAGVPARMVREPVPGLTQARVRGIDETSGTWLLFLDDDNELRPDFVEEGLRFIAARPDVGCFGGKLVLPETTVLPRWAEPFLPYLAVKDAGDEVITGASTEWGPWEPPGAGAWVCREIADEFRRLVAAAPRVLELGRKGKNVLASCEDSLMMRLAVRRGLLEAYNPRLVLVHHLDRSRFRVRYLVRLMSAFGASRVTLDALLRGRVEPSPKYQGRWRSAWRLVRQLLQWRKTSLAFAVASIGFHRSARRRHLALLADASAAPPPRPEAQAAPRGQPDADVPAGTRVLLVGVYLSDRDNHAEAISREVARSERWEVEQRWIALGKAPIPEALAAVTAWRAEAPAPKFALLNRLLAQADLDRYAFVVVCDDDIVLPERFVDRYLEIVTRHRLALAQPARTHDSFIDHPFVEQRDGLLARRTRFVEIGPLFSMRRDAVRHLVPFDPESPMGWGYDFVWPVLMERAGLRMGIVDATAVAHDLRKSVSYYDHDGEMRTMEAFLAGRAHLRRDEAFSIVEAYARPRVAG